MGPPPTSPGGPAATMPAAVPAQTAFTLLRSSIGKKVLMSLSGMVGVGFVTAHMIGNLQILLPGGRERLNHYAAGLRGVPALLWTVRVALVVAVIVHVATALGLTARKRRARPVGYRQRTNLQASVGSRTMIFSGVALLAFIAYHLLHLTFGAVTADFVEGDVAHNVIVGFQNPAISAAYIAAMIALALHLSHGAWSMFQTLGIDPPGPKRWLRLLGRALALVVVVGNISIVVAVLAGWVA